LYLFISIAIDTLEIEYLFRLLHITDYFRLFDIEGINALSSMSSLFTDIAFTFRASDAAFTHQGQQMLPLILAATLFIWLLPEFRH